MDFQLVCQYLSRLPWYQMKTKSRRHASIRHDGPAPKGKAGRASCRANSVAGGPQQFVHQAVELVERAKLDADFPHLLQAARALDAFLDAHFDCGGQ